MSPEARRKMIDKIEDVMPHEPEIAGVMEALVNQCARLAERVKRLECGPVPTTEAQRLVYSAPDYPLERERDIEAPVLVLMGQPMTLSVVERSENDFATEVGRALREAEEAGRPIQSVSTASMYARTEAGKQYNVRESVGF